MIAWRATPPPRPSPEPRDVVCDVVCDVVLENVPSPENVGNERWSGWRLQGLRPLPDHTDEDARRTIHSQNTASNAVRCEAAEHASSKLPGRMLSDGSGYTRTQCSDQHCAFARSRTAAAIARTRAPSVAFCTSSNRIACAVKAVLQHAASPDAFCAASRSLLIRARLARCDPVVATGADREYARGTVQIRPATRTSADLARSASRSGWLRRVDLVHEMMRLDFD